MAANDPHAESRRSDLDGGVLMGAHYFDPAPGQGRINRAWELALTVHPDELAATAENNRRQLENWLAIDIEEHEQGRACLDTRKQIALRMVRAQIGRVALRASALVRAASRSWGSA